MSRRGNSIRKQAVVLTVVVAAGLGWFSQPGGPAGAGAAWADQLSQRVKLPSGVPDSVRSALRLDPLAPRTAATATRAGGGPQKNSPAFNGGAVMSLGFRAQWGGPAYAVALSSDAKTAYLGIGPRLVAIDLDTLSPTYLQATGQTGVLPGVVHGVAVSGTHAYIAAADRGFLVVDIGNLNAPAVALPVPGGDVRAVAVAGDYACLADRAFGLRIVNISNPASPSSAGPGLATAGQASGIAVAVSGAITYAYVADSYAGLQIIDVSNPATPVRVSGFTSLTWSAAAGGGLAVGVAVQGDHAYVADYDFGLQVIKVPTPANPATILSREGGFTGATWAAQAGGGLAVGVALTDGDSHAYVADYDFGLQVIDISTPAAPTRVGGIVFENSHLPLPHWPALAFGVVVAGTQAFVADYNDGLQVVDVTAPNTPLSAGQYDASGPATGLQLVSGNVFLADGQDGLDVINPTLPPSRLGGLDSVWFGNAAAIDVSGTLACIANADQGLQVVNISNPANPQVLGSYVGDGSPAKPGIYAFGVAIAAHDADLYAYVAYLDAGMQVIKITDPANPTRVGGYDFSPQLGHPVYAGAVTLSGNDAYVACFDDGVQILDISDPTAPSSPGPGSHLATADPALAVAIAVGPDTHTYAYVAASGAGLQIFDVSTPSAPTALVTYHDAGDNMCAVVVAGKSAYVGNSEAGVKIIDISAPGNPRLAAGYDTGGLACGVAVGGSGRDTMYVADYDGGLVILHVNDGIAPVISSCGPDLAPIDAGPDGLAVVPDVVTGIVQASDNYTPTGSLAITQDPAAGSTVTAGNHTITITVKDEAGNAAACEKTLTVNDSIAPTVLSVTRVGGTPTNAAFVQYTVTFSESVTGVTTSAFQLTATGVAGASVSGVSADDGTTRTVTVDTGSGDGTIRLDVMGSGTGIVDLASNGLSGGFTTGEVYTIDRTAPTVSTVVVQTGLTVDVTFSEAMGAGATTATHYTVSGTGQGTLAANPDGVSLVNGSQYRLTWTAGHMIGGGDITITVADVQDLAGNLIGTPDSGTHTGGGIGTDVSVAGWASVRTHNGDLQHQLGELPINATGDKIGGWSIIETRRHGQQPLGFEGKQGLVATGNQILVATFGADVTGCYNAGGVLSVTPAVSTATHSLVGGTQLRIGLTGTVPATKYTVDISEVIGCIPSGESKTVALRVCPGNVSLDAKTDLIDMVLTKSKNSHVPTEADPSPEDPNRTLCRFDVNMDGIINLIDMVVVKSLNGTQCPQE